MRSITAISRRQFGLWLLCFSLMSCNQKPTPMSPETSGPKKLKIVTTVGMVTDIVRQVVGDRADVVGLLGDGDGRPA